MFQESNLKQNWRDLKNYNWELKTFLFVVDKSWSFACDIMWNQKCFCRRRDKFKVIFLGKWSLDWISLDIFSWSKFSVNLDVWSKLLFFYFGQLIGTFINVILNFWSCQKLQVIFWHLIKILIMSFWLILNFWSTAKKEPTVFGSWLKFF
jgi:hypothetical protein